MIDGYVQLELAKLDGQVTIDCMECNVSEGEALRLLLARHQKFQFLNAFIRICMALDLEHALQKTALTNRSIGGKNKDSSNLTEVIPLDVRSEIAKISCSSAGNVTKVKQLLRCADPLVLSALHEGEIYIDRAWRWKDFSGEQQRLALDSWRSDRQINKKIEVLLSRHRKK